MGRSEPAPVPEESVVLVDGPWRHRDVTANGARFHAVELGTGPLILLLHGFPEFWWSWRHQLPALSDAGFRVVAPDLRGYGASDKPPRGYDAVTLAADIAGMIRALGERDAVLVGHDWGGLLAWTTATLHPQVVRRLATLGAAHPLALRNRLLTGPPGQRAASRRLLAFQAPRAAEQWLTGDGAANVERLLHAGSGRPDWPDPRTASRYREAMLVNKVAHSSLEYFRWAVRSQVRPDGFRFARLLDRRVSVPVLAIHGLVDSWILPATAADGRRYAAGTFDWQVLDGVGHFPAEEAPEAVTARLLRWLHVGGERNRDPTGRPRNARPRDRHGRPLPYGSEGVARVPDDLVLDPVTALAEADRLLAAGSPFPAHDVLEAVWKSTEAAERDLWQGLAQLAVGLTHAQRGNARGAATLLRRGSDRVEPYAGNQAYGIPVEQVVTASRSLADRIEREGLPGLEPTALQLRLSGSPSATES